MKLPYPRSIPVAFDNFPAAIDIRLGPLAGDLSPQFGLGSKFILTRTPKCGVPEGAYITGAALPECRMIYSDTGKDDNFTIKTSFFGYGTFYKLTRNDPFLRFMVYKAIAVETPFAGERVFGDTFDCETLIPGATDINSLFSYEQISIQYIDPVTPGTGSGSFWLNGVEYHLSAGQSITIASDTGGTNTFTFIGDTLVIS